MAGYRTLTDEAIVGKKRQRAVFAPDGPRHPVPLVPTTRGTAPSSQRPDAGEHTLPLDPPLLYSSLYSSGAKNAARLSRPVATAAEAASLAG
eukprot:scaffold5721_cov50-Phaeocystis_antarctica.AAC.2